MRRTRAAVRIALSSGDSTSAPAREFLQQRLQLFGRWLAILSFGFFVLRVIAEASLNPAFEWTLLVTLQGYAFHVLASAGAAGLWAVTWLSRASSFRILYAADAVATIAVCACFAMMGAGLVESGTAFVDQPGAAMLTATLAVSFTVVWRAVVVPATPIRTAIVSLLAVLPLVATDVVMLWHQGSADAAAGAATVLAAGWCALAVVTSTVAADVVFGLRREVERVQRLGQYTLQEKIGEGAMGMVYRASHAMLRRPTAIKLLPPERAGRATLQRFEREVQLTATLTHPNTVAIYDYGRTPDGVFYYAMELLEGLNLEDLVRRYGPQPEGRVIHILRQICGALAEAHGLGLLHRDIKPANIILTSRAGEADVAKVVDFGLVTRIDANNTPHSGTFEEGQVLAGTPAYFSPEAITTPDQVDPRSDIYALGAVAYFLTTGVRVFEGRTIMEICGHHLHSAPIPPSTRLGRTVEPVLERVILDCLAKQPDARPADALTLGSRLGTSPAAEQWTADHARGWWIAHPIGARAVTAVDPEAETMAVDLARR